MHSRAGGQTDVGGRDPTAVITGLDQSVLTMGSVSLRLA